MMKTIKHYQQPTGNTCGPTCIYMVHKHLNDYQGSIGDIAKLCTTDWVVGTPPDKMILGLDGLDIKYIHHVEPNEPFDLLNNIISKGNITMLRTLTQGIPHWIIVNDYDGKIYNVLDPWLGEIVYNHKDLDYVWSGRNYECFEIITNENN